jgi:hypothetical protein
LLDFMATVEFDHLGTYGYSAEAGTPAAELSPAVSAEEVADREARVADLQASISRRRMTARLGQSFEVVVDAVVDPDDPDSGAEVIVTDLLEGTWRDDREREALARVHASRESVALARSYHFGFDLDGGVVLSGRGRRSGEWLDVRFEAATPFDAWAVPAAAARTSGRES